MARHALAASALRTPGRMEVVPSLPLLLERLGDGRDLFACGLFVFNALEQQKRLACFAHAHQEARRFRRERDQHQEESDGTAPVRNIQRQLAGPVLRSR